MFPDWEALTVSSARIRSTFYIDHLRPKKAMVVPEQGEGWGRVLLPPLFDSSGPSRAILT